MRVLEALKTLGASPAGGVARHLGMTAVAARQHLAALADEGLVQQRRQPPAGRGRPSAAWSLTRRARALFPDRHGELAVGLIRAIREAGGEETLRRIVEVRARDQLNLYRERVPAGASLRRRVEALARQRSAEGYMAEVVPAGAGAYILVEHHCPICDAASACQGLCQSELEVFQGVLGDGVEIERTTHLLSGADRCAYRISRAGGE
jgi:predicted ArsR family transcriptional regulator